MNMVKSILCVYHKLIKILVGCFSVVSFLLFIFCFSKFIEMASRCQEMILTSQICQHFYCCSRYKVHVLPVHWDLQSLPFSQSRCGASWYFSPGYNKISSAPVELELKPELSI